MIYSPRPWCLVLMSWGEKYSDKFVEILVKSVKDQSSSCKNVVLITDRIRSGLSSEIKQNLIPDFFKNPDFFTGGYIVKLSLFHKTILPPDMPCVYIDLDTMINGDVGKIAALVKAPNTYYMLPPASLIGFGFIRRWVYKATNGQRFATGNSSIVAFFSSATPNLCDTFEVLYKNGLIHGRKMKIDDVFISWFTQRTLHKIPKSLAVMFRREFLSRSRIMLAVKSCSPLSAQRRKGLVAVTFNGVQHKPEQFLSLKEGDCILDDKNRFGIWSVRYFGEFHAKILQYAKSVSSIL